jgi:ribonuclease E
LPAAALWQPPEPAAPQVNLAPPAAEPAVSPRRRSTVREPAPMSFGETSTAPAPAIPEPPPAPTVVSAEPAEEEARPRRAGWWSRRVFGKG